MAVVQTLIGNIKGPAGATGATGPTGAAGAAATIEVGTVSTTAHGNPAQVTNSGTPSAAVFDFVIPQGQPGEEVTDMAGLILGTMTTQTGQFPTPAVNDNGATLWGKVVKYFSDLRTLIGTKVAQSAVTTSLSTTEDGFVLDARAGKTLNDKIEAKMSNVAMSRLSAAGSSTTDVFTTSSGGQRHILFALDSTANNCGAWFVFSNNSNVLNYKEIAAASAMTLSKSGASLTIAHNSGSIFYLDITLVGGVFLELTYS